MLELQYLQDALKQSMVRLIAKNNDFQFIEPFWELYFGVKNLDMIVKPCVTS